MRSEQLRHVDIRDGRAVRDDKNVGIARVRGIANRARRTARHRVFLIRHLQAGGDVAIEPGLERLRLTIRADDRAAKAAIAKPRQRIRNQRTMRDRQQWPRRQPLERGVGPGMGSDENNPSGAIKSGARAHGRLFPFSIESGETSAGFQC
jgi:hypothetical protein